MVFRLFLILIVIPSSFVLGQGRFQLSSGQLNFESNAALEVIKASTNEVQGILDDSNNQFAFKIPIRSFKGFNSELQREHFNEKYMESHKFANATFAGKIIENIDYSTDGTYEVRAKGDLEIHGVKQNRIIKATVTVKGTSLTIASSFRVSLSDHNITIPSIVSQKIATEIEVAFAATLKLAQ